MILADKIIEERKKNGWSQEELAEKLGVTRQSVSKWEGAQSTPDLNRLLDMSRLFGVSTDYLLKDEIEKPATCEGDEESADTPLRVVSLEEAQRFLRLKRENAAQIALGVFLCILGVALLALLGGLSEYGTLPLSEDAAGALGMVLLLILIAVAVTRFIRCGQRMREFDFMEEEEFETAYGVAGMAREVRREYAEKYAPLTIAGAVLCIVALVPLFAAVIFTQSERVYVLMAVLMLLILGAGAACFILAGVNRGAVDMLLQEGDYLRRRKQGGGLLGTVSLVYWLTATAIFLIWGFTVNYGVSWIVWPVAGVLYPAVCAIVRTLSEKRD